jgi:hypothetical protein
MRTTVHQNRPALYRCAQERSANGGAHPCRQTWLQRREPLPAHPIELRGRPKARPHQLNFVDEPAAVVVEQAEMDRPLEAAHRVAAIERARQELVLRADKHPSLFTRSNPFNVDRTAHELVNADVDIGLVGFEQAEVGFKTLHRLCHAAAHREADHEVQWLGLHIHQPTPRPRQRNFGLPEARSDGKDLRQTIECYLELPAVRREATRGDLEEGREAVDARDSWHQCFCVHRAAARRSTCRVRFA